MSLLIWDIDRAEGEPGWHGRLKAGTPVFYIQKPTAKVKAFRLQAFLYWSDKRVVPFVRLEDAHAAAESWVKSWMGLMGVVPADETRDWPPQT